MTIWEKAVLNMQKGVQKLTATAATFSERAKAEIAIVRLRVKIDNIQEQIDDHHRTIGRKLEALRNSNTLPKLSDHLLHDEDIAAALSELIDRKSEMEDLLTEMRNEQDIFRAATKAGEEKSA